MLKENGYQESIISKIIKRITNNHSLSQSKQQTQATDIQKEEFIMSIRYQPIMVWYLKKHWKNEIDDIFSKNDGGALKFAMTYTPILKMTQVVWIL